MWHIADWCNYKCSYCCEGRFAPTQIQEQRYVPDAMIEKAALFFSSLKEKWIVRLASGEPSTHPRLFEILKAVTAAGHHIDMTTNLSLPLKHYERFVTEAGGRFKLIHASYHPEHADLDDFAAKCAALQRTIRATAETGHLVASCVATRDNLPTLDRTRAVFERQGVTFLLQREVLSSGFIEYSEREIAALRAWFEDSTDMKTESPRGKSCLAGQRWLFLTFQGNLWRCNTDADKRLGLLGNIGDAAFKFEPRGGPCAHDVCFCPGGPITAEWPPI
jgi:MoaA/NifB/PqqE/SkfB family radical SAM enzyme